MLTWEKDFGEGNEVLKLENVITHYGDVQALQKVSFKVEEGQIVSIIGSNGSGKSTTLNTISGVLPCSSGTIIFHDQRINQNPPHQIVEAGIVQVPEGRRLFPYMTVYENLKLGSFNSRGRTALKESIQEAYQYFPILAERRNQMAGTLSGGEQQMLAIGMALMTKPRLLLMDEPLLGLSPLLQRDLARAIKQIQGEGVTLLITEQFARPLLPIIDRGYVIENGIPVLFGTGRELMENPEVKAAYFGI